MGGRNGVTRAYTHASLPCRMPPHRCAFIGAPSTIVIVPLSTRAPRRTPTAASSASRRWSTAAGGRVRDLWRGTWVVRVGLAQPRWLNVYFRLLRAARAAASARPAGVRARDCCGCARRGSGDGSVGRRKRRGATLVRLGAVALAVTVLGDRVDAPRDARACCSRWTSSPSTSRRGSSREGRREAAGTVA